MADTVQKPAKKPRIYTRIAKLDVPEDLDDANQLIFESIPEEAKIFCTRTHPTLPMWSVLLQAYGQDLYLTLYSLKPGSVIEGIASKVEGSDHFELLIALEKEEPNTARVLAHLSVACQPGTAPEHVGSGPKIHRLVSGSDAEYQIAPDQLEIYGAYESMLFVDKVSCVEGAAYKVCFAVNHPYYEPVEVSYQGALPSGWRLHGDVRCNDPAYPGKATAILRMENQQNVFVSLNKMELTPKEPVKETQKPLESQVPIEKLPIRMKQLLSLIPHNVEIISSCAFSRYTLFRDSSGAAFATVLPNSSVVPKPHTLAKYTTFDTIIVNVPNDLWPPSLKNDGMHLAIGAHMDRVVHGSVPIRVTRVGADELRMDLFYNSTENWFEAPAEPLAETMPETDQQAPKSNQLILPQLFAGESVTVGDESWLVMNLEQKQEQQVAKMEAPNGAPISFLSGKTITKIFLEAILLGKGAKKAINLNPPPPPADAVTKAEVDAMAEDDAAFKQGIKDQVKKSLGLFKEVMTTPQQELDAAVMDDIAKAGALGFHEPVDQGEQAIDKKEWETIHGQTGTVEMLDEVSEVPNEVYQQIEEKIKKQAHPEAEVEFGNGYFGPDSIPNVPPVSAFADTSPVTPGILDIAAELFKLGSEWKGGETPEVCAAAFKKADKIQDELKAKYGNVTPVTPAQQVMLNHFQDLQQLAKMAAAAVTTVQMEATRSFAQKAVSSLALAQTKLKFYGKGMSADALMEKYQEIKTSIGVDMGGPGGDKTVIAIKKGQNIEILQGECLGDEQHKWITMGETTFCNTCGKKSHEKAGNKPVNLIAQALESQEGQDGMYPIQDFLEKINFLKPRKQDMVKVGAKIAAKLMQKVNMLQQQLEGAQKGAQGAELSAMSWKSKYEAIQEAMIQAAKKGLEESARKDTLNPLKARFENLADGLES